MNEWEMENEWEEEGEPRAAGFTIRRRRRHRPLDLSRRVMGASS